MKIPIYADFHFSADVCMYKKEFNNIIHSIIHFCMIKVNTCVLFYVYMTTLSKGMEDYLIGLRDVLLIEF